MHLSIDMCTYTIKTFSEIKFGILQQDATAAARSCHHLLPCVGTELNKCMAVTYLCEQTTRMKSMKASRNKLKTDTNTQINDQY